MEELAAAPAKIEAAGEGPSRAALDSALGFAHKHGVVLEFSV